MSDAKKQAEEIAALRRELDELKGKVDPPKSTFVPMTDAEHSNWVHQMRERQANSWMPPSAVQEMANHPCNQVMGGVIQDRHAPNTPAMIPTSQSGSGGSGEVRKGTGYSDTRPLGPPPGIQWVDAQLIADEVRQRAELKRKLGEG